MLIAVIHAWWFVALPVGIIGLSKYRYFWEIVLAGFVYDALFNFSLTPNIYAYVGVIVTFVCYCTTFLFKKIVRE